MLHGLLGRRWGRGLSLDLINSSGRCLAFASRTCWGCYGRRIISKTHCLDLRRLLLVLLLGWLDLLRLLGRLLLLLLHCVILLLLLLGLGLANI